MYLTCITITQSTIITSPIGFNIGLTNVDTRLNRRCFNIGHWRCINVVQRWKSDVRFCFIFNVGSTLFQRWSTTLIRRWNNGCLWNTFLKQSQIYAAAGLFPVENDLFKSSSTSKKYSLECLLPEQLNVCLLTERIS